MWHFNNKLPKYAEDKFDGYALMKFLEEKWQQDYFLDGKLYMKSPFDFHDEKLGEGRWDTYEGSDIVVCPPEDKYAMVKFKVQK